MRRRAFIALAGSAAAWPFAARAQQAADKTAMPVIGYLGGPSPQDAPVRFAGLHQGLKDAGFVAGENVTIEYRATADRYDRFPEFAFDLVHRPVDVIFASEKAASIAARGTTKTIPVVFALGGDPVFMRLVASMMRPGGNVTGVSFVFTTIMAKQLELLHQAVPDAGLVAVLTNIGNAYAVSDATRLQRAADKLGLQLLSLSAGNERQFDAACATLLDRKAGALVVEGDPFLSAQQGKLVALTAEHKIPAIYADPENAGGGGLMTYGVSIADAFRLAGVTIGRVLKGEKPADLPVVQSTKNDLVINLKTAKTLGLTVPPSLLTGADKVIE
jgi:putative tryptophan/tyrosine transport system substrate-binding protein